VFGKERFRDYLAYKIIGLSHATFKARLMDKLPFYKEAAFCQGVSCYVSSTTEMKRSDQVFNGQVYQWLTSFQPHEVFYDIGANIGMFSLTVAKFYNKKVKTYSFEPSFSTFAALVRNVMANRFDDVVFPFSIVLGEHQGVRRFNYSSTISGAAVHTLDKTVDQRGTEFAPIYSQNMISYSMDDLLENYSFPCPTHIKIDVDGGELEVLAGMKKTLENSSVKSVLIEITESEDNAEDVKRISDIFESTSFGKILQIIHKSTKKSPIISDFLFARNWSMPQQ